MIADEDVDLRNTTSFIVNESLKLQLTHDFPLDEGTAAPSSSIGLHKRQDDDAHEADDPLNETMVSFSQESDPAFSNVFCGNLAHTLEWLKNWSVWSYNRTRKKFNESVGKASLPRDVELEQSMDALTDVQERYAQLLQIVLSNVSALQTFLRSQENFNQGLLEVMKRDDSSLKVSVETMIGDQSNLTRLLPFYCVALDHFVQSLRTLCETTFEDTIATIQRYESARSDYDFRRSQLDALTQNAADSASATAAVNTVPDNDGKIAGQRIEMEKCRKKYEDLRTDVQMKMTLLHQNKTKVMQKNLHCFCNATAAFYAGDADALQKTLAKFNLTSQLLQMKDSA